MTPALWVAVGIGSFVYLFGLIWALMVFTLDYGLGGLSAFLAPFWPIMWPLVALDAAAFDAASASRTSKRTPSVRRDERDWEERS